MELGTPSSPMRQSAAWRSTKPCCLVLDPPGISECGRVVPTFFPAWQANIAGWATSCSPTMQYRALLHNDELRILIGASLQVYAGSYNSHLRVLCLQLCRFEHRRKLVRGALAGVVQRDCDSSLSYDRSIAAGGRFTMHGRDRRYAQIQSGSACPLS